MPTNDHILRVQMNRLTSDCPATRRDAALELGKFPGSAAAAALEGALEDPDVGVRARAAFSLRRVGAAHSVGILSRHLLDPREDDGVRLEILLTLGHIRARRAEEAIVAATHHDSPRIRATACLALGQQRCRRSSSVEVLLGLLDDSAWEVRWQAAAALARIGEIRVLPALQQLLSDPDTPPDIRSEIDKMVGVLSTRSPEPETSE
jgi:hypothetical protein